LAILKGGTEPVAGSPSCPPRPDLGCAFASDRRLWHCRGDRGGVQHSVYAAGAGIQVGASVMRTLAGHWAGQETDGARFRLRSLAVAAARVFGWGGARASTGARDYT